MLSSVRFILLSLVCIFAPISSEARWALQSEADVETLVSHRNIVVNADGTFTERGHIELKILNEAGRDAMAVQRFDYSSTVQTLKIFSAKTVVGDKEYIVPENKIEDQPKSSTPQGLEQINQILVPFSKVKVGSILHFDFEQTLTHVDVPGVFGMLLKPNGFVRDWKVSLTSEIPLNIKVNDPKKLLKVKRAINSKKASHISISNREPIFEHLFGEGESNFVDPTRMTSVSISSESDYSRYGKALGQKYAAVLAEPLPPLLKKIADYVQKGRDEGEQLDRAVLKLIHDIHYFGSWDCASGGMIPRSLAQITETGYGDCKEFSTCLVKILREMGYTADVAMVERGDVYIHWDNLPSPTNEFNHVIVKVRTPSGRHLWIDPTNAIAMSCGIFKDISERPSLVLNVDKPSYEMIPAINPSHATLVEKEEISRNADGSVRTKIDIKLNGESSGTLVEMLTSQPLSAVVHEMVNECATTENPKTISYQIPTLKKRRVVPLEVTLEFDEDDVFTHTNLDATYSLDCDWAKPFLSIQDSDEGIVHVGSPETREYHLTITNAEAKDLDALAYEVKTPWLTAKRELRTTDNGVQAIQKVEILKSYITPREHKSPEFKNLQKILRKYCTRVAIALKETGK